jgi:hypothetical protein
MVTHVTWSWVGVFGVGCLEGTRAEQSRNCKDGNTCRADGVRMRKGPGVRERVLGAGQFKVTLGAWRCAVRSCCVCDGERIPDAHQPTNTWRNSPWPSQCSSTPLKGIVKATVSCAKCWLVDVHQVIHGCGGAGCIQGREAGLGVERGFVCLHLARVQAARCDLLHTQHKPDP